MRKRVLLLTLVLSQWVPLTAANAEWIRVSSEAVIVDDDLDAARKSARSDAYQRANAELKADLEDGNTDTLATSTYQCRSATALNYRKRVGFLGFSMQHRPEGAVGRLENMERGLPATLVRLLNQSLSLQPHSASQIRLYQESFNAPTYETEQRILSKAVKASRELGVQFVVSGVIRSVALHNQNAYKNTLIKRSMRYWKLVDLQRDFSVDLFIHDGFSGALLFEQRYHTQALWPLEKNQQVAFMSPAFQQLAYGQKVLAQLRRMAAHIEESVRCQPFMARITHVEDRQILFGSGTNAGIRPGDQFQLYRARQLFRGDTFQGAQLFPVKEVLQVSQVQSEFAMGTLNTDPTRLNIQQGDVLVRW